MIWAGMSQQRHDRMDIHQRRKNALKYIQILYNLVDYNILYLKDQSFLNSYK